MRFLIIVFCLVFLTGCSEKPKATPSTRPLSTEAIKKTLPKEATEVKSLGNGWYSFKLDNRKYIYKFYRDFNGPKYVLVPEPSK
jgi:hypothetical protein